MTTGAEVDDAETERIRSARLDKIALTVAREVDNIFARGHHSVAQRTARVQIAVREALRKARTA